MKKLNKIITIMVLICFGINSVSFAIGSDSFKLAAPSSFSSMKGLEFKEAAQVQIGIREVLKDLQELTIDSIKSLGPRKFAEKTVFTRKIFGTIYFDEAQECGISDEKIYIEAGNYLVKAKTANNNTYHCLISKAKDGKGHDISVVPDRALAEALQKGSVKFTHGSVNNKDKIIIDLYTEHEITTENNIAIDEWIRERMESGEYEVDDIAGTQLPQYNHTGRYIFKRDNYTHILDRIKIHLEHAGVRKDNRDAIFEKMSATPLVLIPYDDESRLPRIKINGQSVIVTAHSSEFATYIFVPRKIYEAIGSGLWSDEVSEYVELHLIHEIGARCGLNVTVKDGRAWNLLDEVVSGLERGKKITPCPELENLSPVNLLDLELRNDYAAGSAGDKKSIFKRMISLVFAGISAFTISGFAGEATPNIPNASTPKREPIVAQTPKVSAEIMKLIDKLQDKDYSIRKAASEELVKIGALAVDPLIKVSNDKNNSFREDAIRALVQIKDPRSVETLIYLLKDDSVWIFKYAAEGLAELKDQRAVVPLIDVLKHRLETNMRCDAARALGKIGDQRAFDSLIKALLRDPDSTVFSAATEALGDLGDKRAIEPLVRILGDDSYDARRWAASSLDKLNWKPKTQPEKIVYLVAKGEWEELVKIGEPAVDVLIKALCCDRVRVYEKVSEALARIGEPIVVPLINAFENKSIEDRYRAAIALGLIQDPRAIPVLINALSDEELYFDNENIVKAALVRFKDPKVTESIIKLLNNSSHRCRERAASVLGMLNDKRAIGPLVKALEDNHDRIRRQSATSLDMLGWVPTTPQEKILYFIAMQNKEELAKIGGSAIPPLKNMLKDNIYSARRFATDRFRKFAVETLDKLNWVPENIQDKILYFIAKEDFEFEALVKIGQTDVAPLVVIVEGSKDSWARAITAVVLKKLNWQPNDQDQRIRFLIASKDWDKVAQIGEPAVLPLITALEEDNYDFRKGASYALAKIKDARAVDPLIKALDSDVEWYAEDCARRLGEMWPVSKKAVPALIATMRKGNAGALWIIGKGDDDIAKEALSAATSTMVEFVKRFWSSQTEFKFELLERVGKERIIKLAEGFSENDRKFLSLICLTSQTVRPGYTDLGLENIVTNWEPEKLVSNIFNNPDVTDNLKVLEKLNPELAKKYVSSIVSVGYDDHRPLSDFGYPLWTTWAADSLSSLSEDIRTNELARRSTVTKLLIQEGYLRVRLSTKAEFAWSHKPSIKIDLPPILWDREDVPVLKRLVNSEYPVYQEAAKAALKDIEEQNRRAKDKEGVLNAIKSQNFEDRYWALHALDMKDAVPQEYLPFLKEALNEDNWWIHELAVNNLVKISEPAVVPMAEILGSDKWYTRFSAAVTLGKIGPAAKSALPKLQELAENDKSSQVRQATKEAIEKINKSQQPQGQKRSAKEEPKETPKGKPVGRLMPGQTPAGLESMEGRIDAAIPALASMRQEAREQTDRITGILWQAAVGTMTEEEARKEIVMFAPEIGQTDIERNMVLDRWLQQANVAALGLNVKRIGRNAAPNDKDIQAVAARIKEAGIEIFIPKSQVPGDAVTKYKGALESIGGKLRVYQNVEDLQGMITNPAKSIVMAIDATESEEALLENLRSQMAELRFMSFAKMEGLSKMSVEELDNYQAETLGILLVARIITPEDCQDKGSPTYRLLSHLLEGYMPEGVTVGSYIQDIVANAARLIKTVLKALPATTYKAMRQAVEVLWSA